MADPRGTRALARARLGGLTTAALLLIGAPAAIAAPAATLSGGTLTVSGEAAAETFTVGRIGLNVEVTGPAGVNDPDGAGTDCSASGGTASCAAAVVTDILVDAGDGDDALSFSAPTFVSGEVRLVGGAGNDTLTKNTFTYGGVTLDGAGGADVLNAGLGALGPDDTGGADNDTLNGSAQESDDFASEPGSDTYNGGTRIVAAGEVVDDPAAYQLDNAADSLDYTPRVDALAITLDGVANDGSPGEADNIGSDVEVLNGGAGADTMTAGAASVRLRGRAGNDTLNGSPAADSLDGGDGSDSLAGNGGDDFLDDGDYSYAYVDPGDPPLPPAGVDQLNGGPGDDNLYTDRGADDIRGGDGADWAYFSRSVAQPSAVTTPVVQAGFDISLDDRANDGVRGAAEGDNVNTDIEAIASGGGDDIIAGTADPERFETGAGADTITAGAGVDVIDAGFGDDTVSAVDQTTDIIYCSKGSDRATVDLPGGQPERADLTNDCETISGEAFAALPDTRKPVLTLRGSTQIKSKTFLRKGILPVRVGCSRPCALRGEAFTGRSLGNGIGRLSVGAGKRSLAPGTRTLNVKVATRYLKQYRRKLRTRAQRRKGIAFTVIVTSSDAIGIQARSSRRITVKG